MSLKENISSPNFSADLGYLGYFGCLYVIAQAGRRVPGVHADNYIAIYIAIAL